MHTTRRWAVALTSANEIDLKIARTLFEVGDPQVSEITIFTGQVKTVLFAEQFDTMTDANEVYEACGAVIDAINGICFIHDDGRSPFRSEGIHERQADGGWGGGIVFAVATASGTSRAVAFGEAVDKDGNVLPNPQSQQSVWLQHAVKSGAMLEVLSYLRDRPDWFSLYKAFETMKKNGGGTQAGWPDTNDFTQSANIRRHWSGHPSAKPKPGFVPMDLKEATTFVRSLAAAWLNSKV